MAQYSMPSEEGPHEGTWLQWPHNYTYGSGAEDVEASWVAMTAALTEGERVHIIAYNAGEIDPHHRPAQRCRNRHGPG